MSFLLTSTLPSEPLAPGRAAVSAGLWKCTWQALCFVPLLAGWEREATLPCCWAVSGGPGWVELPRCT